MDLDRYNQLTKRVEEMRRERDQIVGAKKELQARLEKEFGVKTLKEAKELLRKLDQQIETEGLRYEQLLVEAESAAEYES
jgi:hypothetical protein